MDDFNYFFRIKSYDDSSLKYYLSILNKFDSTDESKNFLCDKAAEKVGDIYKYRKDYSRALAYYDSADTKYKDKLEFCGNAYYIDFIPRQYKKSQCYLDLKNIKQAIKILTPHIFNNLGASYFDSSMFTYYLTTLNMLYSKQEIRRELKNVLNKFDYNTSIGTSLDTTVKYLRINFIFKIFDSELVCHTYTTSTDKDNKIPFSRAKNILEYAIRGLLIYKLLQD